MANTDWNRDSRQGFGAHQSVADEPGPGSDLKDLLHSIVDQLSDADQRHSDTLQDMRERLANMAREARVLRGNVPDHLMDAFDRIEVGMAELSHRIGETPDLSQKGDSEFSNSSQTPLTKNPSSSNLFGLEPPMALRSAHDSFVPPSHSFNAEQTFDIIETRAPASGGDVWPFAASHTRLGEFGSHPQPFEREHSPSASLKVDGTIDQPWLEARFAEIAKRIEESIADIRPDDGFFALGQRLETVEQHVVRVADTVATRADVEGLRLIEAHISEVTAHLEHTHNQLTRLDSIETALAEISQRLLDVQHPSASSSYAAAMPNVGQNSDEMRGLIERFMSQSRQGEESTHALLDTLQQAMIRLLDRVDAMEVAQHQSFEIHAAPPKYAPEPAAFNASPVAAKSYTPPDAQGALDAAVAAFASANALASPLTSPAVQPQAITYDSGVARAAADIGRGSRSPDAMRQDYIANARRARMRLSGDDELPTAQAVEVKEAPYAGPAPVSATAKKDALASKPAPRTATSAPKKSAQPTSALRLFMMALCAVSMLAGVWFILDGGKGRRAISKSPDATPSGTTAKQSQETTQPKSSMELAPSIDGSAGEGVAPPATDDSSEPVEGGAQPSGSDAPSETRGEIIPGELTIGQTTVPLLGIAVDTEQPVSAAEVERVNRRQTMAKMSSRIGQAAANMTDASVTPAALIPAEGSLAPNFAADAGAPTNGLMQNAALDMPPVTVGPLSLRLAAAKGDPSAQFDVGAKLAEGQRATANYKEAAKWYQRSADQGFVQAQYRLGTLYERGLGLKADQARAKSWYQRAADRGNVKAMHNLAVMSANQSKGTPDYTTAARWFTSAAERGLADSQFNLAVLHENGLGVEQDLKQTYKWLAIAARSGDTEAIKRRDLVKGKLSIDDLAAAEGLIRTWKMTSPDQLSNDARAASEAWKKNPQNGVNG
jgi:localization factor PodJL